MTEKWKGIGAGMFGEAEDEAAPGVDGEDTEGVPRLALELGLD